jgi:hypothetical protein
MRGGCAKTIPINRSAGPTLADAAALACRARSAIPQAETIIPRAFRKASNPTSKSTAPCQGVGGNEAAGAVQASQRRADRPDEPTAGKPDGS